MLVLPMYSLACLNKIEDPVLVVIKCSDGRALVGIVAVKVDPGPNCSTLANCY